MPERYFSGEEVAAAGQNIKERDYWLDKLSGQWLKTTFPYDRGRDKEDTNKRKMMDFTFPQRLCSSLLRLANGSDYRLFMIFLAGLNALLYKYTDSKDIIVGSPIYKQDIEGEFINTVLALRSSFNAASTFKELLLQARNVIGEAVENQNYPIDAIIFKLDLQVTAGTFPLFDVALLLENIQEKNYLNVDRIQPDMIFSFVREGEHIRGVLDYKAGFYGEAGAARILSHFRQLLQNAAADIEVPLWALDILPEEEKKQLLFDFMGVEACEAERKTVIRLFEEQVEKCPGVTAVIGQGAGHRAVTYREINKKANRVAYLLKEKGVEPGAIVALVMEPGIERIAVVLGIIKTGSAYLPIDPGFPPQRILAVLEDSGCGIVFAENNDRMLLTGRGREVIPPNRLLHEAENYPAANPGHIAQPGDLLYLIPTSGSTGKPKTVMMEHGNLVNLLYFQSNKTNIDFRQRVLQFASIGFDVSAQEIFSTLTAGGTLYPVPTEMKTDVLRLFHWIEKETISILFLPPSFLKLIFSNPEYAAVFPKSVEHIIAAGEQLVVPGPLKDYLKNNRVFLHNHYGPTETHVVTSLTIDPAEEIAAYPSIGRPIINTGIYILDENKNPRPMGAVGDLYISGANVGRGYLNRPELTAEKFCLRRAGALFKKTAPAPRKNFLLKKIYKTGDLARWLEDGSIEFIGRADFQVKIKGFRIELEEIEKQLTKVSYIKEAVVIDRQDSAGDSYLCAYIVSDRDTAVSGLRDILSETLPEYMLPQYYVRMDRIPVTANGKVNRKALPVPEVKSGNVYAAPRDETDERLVRIWSEILGLEKDRTGIDDNFFELGGNSLKATILITRVHKGFNSKITLADIFEQPTIRGLATYIKGVAEDRHTSIEAVEKKEYYPFSSAQKRLYIQQQIIPGNTSYNMPLFFILEGRLDRERLATVFRQLVSRHESFRTSFEMVEEEPVQRIHDQVEFKIQGPAAIETFVRPFDLASAPLLRVGLLEVARDRHILMVDMHHIITDGTSFGVLSREFMQLYKGEKPSLLALQYKDFSQWQNRLFLSGEIEKQERYWLKQFEGEIPVLNLPTDFPRPETRSYEGRGISFEINREITAAVNRMALETGTTLHVVLLAIYNILLAKYGGREDIVVGTGIAGRQHADLENVIGLFINMLAVRNQPAENKTFIQFLGEVKENALNAYANQDYQFEELVRKLELQGNPARNPLFDVVFQTQNMDIPGIEIQDLTLKPYDREFSASHFDLVIYIWEEGDWLSMRIVYSPALFKKSTLQHMAEHFVEIAGQVLKDRDVLIKDIKITTHFSAAASRVPKHDTQFQF